MRYPLVTITNDGKRKLNWTGLIGFVALTYVLVVGSAEVFWRLFTGGFSALIGGFALVVATLIVIRVIGSAVYRRPYLFETEF